MNPAAVSDLDGVVICLYYFSSILVHMAEPLMVCIYRSLDEDKKGYKKHLLDTG